jgi:hypothetical protein
VFVNRDNIAIASCMIAKTLFSSLGALSVFLQSLLLSAGLPSSTIRPIHGRNKGSLRTDHRGPGNRGACGRSTA